MIDVLKLNSISKIASVTLGANYNIVDNCADPLAVLVRSYDMHGWTVPDSLLCVARAGAGVNNIPYDEYAKRGIVVFNTPGANANAVKELIICALIASSRNFIAGSNWAQSLSGDDVKTKVEKGKGQFAGTEILGKTLGILGLGAIGRMVAVSANALGMKVIAYDPYISEETKALSFVTMVGSIYEVLVNCDFLTLHTPFNKATAGLINAAQIEKMKDGVIILNAARGELVVTADVKAAIASGKVRAYYTDFPDSDCLNSQGIIVTPHLGASSEEAEENCALMAASEIKLFLEEGTIKNSVNMPYIWVAKETLHRASVIYSGKLPFETTASVTNKDGISYAIIDSDDEIDVTALSKAPEVIKARLIY